MDNHKLLCCQFLLVHILLIVPTLFSTVSASHFRTQKTNTTAKETAQEKEVIALLEWKASLDNKSQMLLSSWASREPCNWFGIGCNRAERVVSLNFSNCGIRGTVHDLDFSSLPHLSSIDFYNNSFYRTIPSKIGNLSELQYLHLSTNFFSGSIPPEIGTLANLEHFCLYKNRISGSIPPNLGHLRSLQLLDLGFNNITGSIPNTIGNMSSLYFLAFPRNQLSGHIPPTVGNLTNLQYFYPYDNQLSGPIPHEIGMLSFLVDLAFSGNHLTGQIPPSIGKLSNLRDLYFRVNKLSGPIPEEIGMMKSLYDLDLGMNNLTGPVPSSMGNLSDLTYLALYENNFHGQVLKSIKNCTDLYRIDVGKNNFEGNVSEEFGIYPHLSYIYLSDNRFHGDLSVNWGLFGNLTGLRMSRNRLVGRIPPELGEASKLQIIDLSSNQLTGTIPPNLGNLSFLLELRLNGNKLSGEIPLEIGRLSKLLRLNLAVNNLSGPVPKELGECRQLLDLNLSKNSLTREIPFQLGGVYSLTFLDFSYNMLSGEIPHQLGELKSFEVLNLSHNELSGSIPSSFSHCVSLKSVDISYNQLEGPLPNISAFYEASLNSLRNNKGLCANISGFRPCPALAHDQVLNRSSSKGILVLIIFPVLGAALFFVVALFLVSHSRKTRRPRTEPQCQKANLFALWSFNGKMVYEDIIKATEDFNPNYCIGVGGDGSVFKAKLSNGQVVAVKKLHTDENSGLSNAKGFKNEISLLAKLRHRNIVKLHGFCSHSQHSFLVYEFLEGGSLKDLLNSDERAKQFEWFSRIMVIKDVASALSYMHHDCTRPIVHRDISSKNVLFDSQNRACLSDFGTARILMPHASNWTGFAGTYGYAAPELAYTMEVSEKCDVYSFGVLGLELIMGKHPADTISILSTLSSVPLDIPLEEVLDKRISSPSSEVAEEVTLVAKLSISCLHPNPQCRPTMQQVSVQLARKRSSESKSLFPSTIGHLLDEQISASRTAASLSLINHL